MSQSPFNSIPPVALALVLLVAGIEGAFQAQEAGLFAGSAAGWRQQTFDGWAFFPAVLSEMFERGRWSVDLVKRFASYVFIHVSFQHGLWATVLLLALGKFVGEAYRPVAFVVLFFGSAIGAAVVYGYVALALGQNFPLLGAYPGIYGLIGAYTYILWLRLAEMGENQLRAFTLIGLLMGITLVYSVLFGSSPWWMAEASGFVIGLFLAPICAPGGLRALLERLRRR